MEDENVSGQTHSDWCWYIRIKALHGKNPSMIHNELQNVGGDNSDNCSAIFHWTSHFYASCVSTEDDRRSRETINSNGRELSLEEYSLCFQNYDLKWPVFSACTTAWDLTPSHPTYSSDMNALDFHLSPKLKHFRGTEEVPEEVIQAIWCTTMRASWQLCKTFQSAGRKSSGRMVITMKKIKNYTFFVLKKNVFLE